MARAVVRVTYRRVARALHRVTDRLARPVRGGLVRLARTAPGRPGSRRPARRGSPRPEGSRPFARALGLGAVVLVGAWLGLLAVGTLRTPVGPVDTGMTLRPSLTGGTTIDVPPLGSLDLDTHLAPLRLDVDVEALDPDRARALVEHPERLSGLQDEIGRDVADGAWKLAFRSSVAVLSGATALGLAVYRRPRRALAAGGLALALLATSGTVAYATWNRKSVLEPRFSGLLTSAPSVVGNARSIVTEFDVYQKELARLVTNVTKLYETTSTLPTYQPDPSTIRVLHVSDIHLNPLAWHVIGSLVKQYRIDLIIDSGDTMDHGTAAENRFLDPVGTLGAPYVWVRGNHDSMATQEYLEALPNVHVLDDGRAVTVAGVRVAGIGDPQYTPDRSVRPLGDASEHAAGRALAAALRAEARAGTPVDIAVAHNPLATHEVDGLVPLALAGHMHRRINEVLGRGTRLKIEGSTGGGGLRALEQDPPALVEASLLYLDRETRRLQAWDEITLGGLGLTSVEVSRHIPDEVLPDTSPSPGTPPDSPSPSPFLLGPPPSPSGSPPAPPASPSPSPAPRAPSSP
ncbi:hypothetical protein BJP40_23785 [Streptomyces sp. CC53]|uniref:metallophosphoesterase family protein n=1 Tax=unclassified Streptomyces TaxID=2593676 RepID=UPI0008DE1210|nr:MULTISPECIES: metallophosphoesterase [unclassified Streptomyces]OII63557.1 hypothetical protein BJP40_23785 [Streptomyces sp. CC53]